MAIRQGRRGKTRSSDERAPQGKTRSSDERAPRGKTRISDERAPRNKRRISDERALLDQKQRADEQAAQRGVLDAFDRWCRAMSWQRAVDRALHPLGLTHTQYWLLLNAQQMEDETNDAVSQQQIAEAARLDKMTVSYLARKLESRGLLSRGPSYEGPAVRVIVTAKGRRTLTSAGPLVAQAARVRER